MGGDDGAAGRRMTTTSGRHRGNSCAHCGQTIPWGIPGVNYWAVIGAPVCITHRGTECECQVVECRSA
jgi:hypothetical protein